VDKLKIIRSIWLAFVLTVGLVATASAQESAVLPDTNVGRWAFLVGTFLPLAAAAVIRQRWRSEVKGGAVFVFSVLAAAGTSYFAGEFERGDFLSAALIILVMASITYQTLWKPSGIAPAIEQQTG
jgi:FtsH-binding integral membrane protein